MVGVGEETDTNLLVRSLSRLAGVIAVSEKSVPLWGPLFDLTWNYVPGELLLLEMLTFMTLVKVTLGGSSR